MADMLAFSPKRLGGQSVTIPLSTLGARVPLAWTTALQVASRSQVSL